MKEVVPHNISIAEIVVPASKSFAQRALIAAALSKDRSTISGIGFSSDVVNIIDVVRNLGAFVELEKQDLQIKGFERTIREPINCGESGLGIRLATPVFSVLGFEGEIKGEGSLLTRPMDEIEAAINALGGSCKTNDGKIPIVLEGSLQGGSTALEGSRSSQFLSGLLMALPLAPNDSILTVKNLKSKSYVQMTIDMLEKFQIQIDNEDFQTFRIKGNQEYHGIEYKVEGDWSAAAFWAVFGAIKGPTVIKGLKEDSTQADVAILSALQAASINYHWSGSDLIIEASTVKKFEFDATDCPDLFPALVVLAAAAEGVTTLRGVNRLKHKESDRGLTLQSEFKKLGLHIELQDDLMLIHGTGKLTEGKVQSHNDHRIAMACGIAACLTESEVVIEDADAVKKSYPDFWDDILA